MGLGVAVAEEGEALAETGAAAPTGAEVAYAEEEQGEDERDGNEDGGREFGVAREAGADRRLVGHGCAAAGAAGELAGSGARD